MKRSATEKKLFSVFIVAVGIFFYLYYGIYKMLLAHSTLLGKDYAYIYLAIQNFFNGQSLYMMPHGHPPFFMHLSRF